MSISCTASRHTISVNFPHVRQSGRFRKTLRDVRGLFGELGCAGNHAACCRGMINQIGIWTEQPLWKANGASEQYNLNLVKGLNDVAVGLAEQNQPLSLILSANPSNTGRIRLRGVRLT